MQLHIRDDQIGRYFRRLQLGLRFLAHGARPQTICQWTALTANQLITLRRRWGFEGDDILRGPSPYSFDKIFNSWTRRHQAALFLSICQMIGVVPSRRGPDAVKRLPSIENGEGLCEAFEIFKEWEPGANFDFERIEFLLVLLRGIFVDEQSAVILQVSAIGPHFPLVGMLAFAVGFGVALILYYGLIAPAAQTNWTIGSHNNRAAKIGARIIFHRTRSAAPPGVTRLFIEMSTRALTSVLPKNKRP